MDKDSAFHTRYMGKPTQRSNGVYDYEICYSEPALRETLAAINDRGYVLISATQGSGAYTLFFWRPIA